MLLLLLIGFYVLDEFANDRHFSRIDQMYRVKAVSGNPIDAPRHE